jgi:hypothetical protein
MLKTTEPSSSLSSAELFCVAPHLIDSYWPHVVTLVRNAVLRGRGDYTVEYVYKRLKKNQALLWLVVKDGAIKAAGTTEINSMLDGPQRVCVITTFAGNNIADYDYLMDDIEHYAISEQCSLIRVYGREGWSRYLRNRGYKQPWIALEKRLGSE